MQITDIYIYIINGRGPKADPCGTPYFKYHLLD